MVFTHQSPKCLSPPAGWKGAQARVREGEGRGGFRPQHQIRCHHAHVDAADDVCRALHVGHQQRLLQSQRGARLVQSRRVRLPVTGTRSETLGEAKPRMQMSAGACRREEERAFFITV